MTSIKMFIVALAVVAALAGAASAQTGSITGTVKDANGGIVPGADVTAANSARGISRTAVTNDQGVFVFAQIPAGSYTVTVEKSGFKRIELADVVLSAGDQINAGEFQLEPGAISATVQIQADAGQLLLKSESGERADVVTGTQLRNIGLNGRNSIDLVKLVPGVISGGLAGGVSALSIVGQFNINGTRSDQHEVTVDGVTNFNLGNNTAGLVTVNPDALEEVKILTSNYQAEYGRSGGGFIALTTRGGTNEYHGSGRYFRRHDSMNANNYFNNARGASSIPRPLYRYNYYGWDFGGPVYLPRFGEGGPSLWSGKEKMFFFISQEYYNQLVPAGATNIRVPTAAERAGNFSNSIDGSGNRIFIKDPLLSGTCTAALQAANAAPCFPNGIIPANRLYAPGLATLNVAPLPNSAGSNVFNYTSQLPNSSPRRETILRMDWQANSSTRLSGRWVRNTDQQLFNLGTTTASWNFPLTVTARNNGPGNTLSFTVTKNFGPTLINEFTFGAGRGGVTIAPVDDKATRSATGINTPLLFPNANTPNLIPSLNFGAIANAAATANTSVFGTFVQQFVINNFIDNVTKVKGNHTFKFGVYYQRASNASNSQNAVQSNIDFSNNGSNPFNTGYGFANAALGVYTGYTQASEKILQSYFYTDLSFYLQDNWKIHRRLTLDVGMRFSHYSPYVNRIGSESFFNPELFDRSKAMRIYRPVCVGASPCAATAATYRAIDPATTGAPTLANTLPGFNVGKLVPNSGSFTNGLGLSTEGYKKGGIDTKFVLPQPRLGFAWDVTGNHTTIVRGGAGIAYDRYRSDVTGNAAQNQPFVLNPALQFGFLQDIVPGGSGALSPSIIGGTDENGDWPAVYSYSIGVQRELLKGTVVDVSFVGSQSRHLPRRTNLNAIPYGATFKASAQDPTRFAGGVIPATEPGLPAAHAAAGLSFSGQFALPIDFLRPFPGYGDITFNNYDGNSSYKSLQVSAQRRFSQGLTFGIAYTLSRVTTTVSDNTTFTSIVDASAYDYALAAFDRKHFFIANFVWGLPKGSRHLGNNGLTRALFDNWTLSGVTTIATGNPAELGLTLTGTDAGGRLLGSYSAGNSSGQQPRLRVTGSAQSAPNQINLSAFSVPGINDVGPYSRAYLRNPGITNQDLALSKSFPFGKDGKRYLQLRVEAFNVFNHTQFSGVNRTTNIVNGLGQQANNAAFFNNYSGFAITNNLRPAGSGAVLGTFFGEYNAARDPRILQLAAKVYF
jgi:hypothetical protein